MVQVGSDRRRIYTIARLKLTFPPGPRWKTAVLTDAQVL